MIHGIGIDIVEVERVRAAVGKWGEKFLNRIFTEREIAYCYTHQNPYPSLAVRLAAKEALIKALGADTRFSFTDIEVVNAESGRPVLLFSERVRAHLKKNDIASAHVTLSHERNYGIASVILERKPIAE